MIEDPQEVQRTRFLLTNLVIITIFILTLIFLVAAYPVLLAPEPTVTPTATSTLPPSWTPSPTAPTPTVSLTPAPSRTLLPTLTPSITPTPTETPVPTATPVPLGPPTLTPARPLANNFLYSLQNWTPEKADHLIQLLESYPNNLPENARGEDDAAYYQAFRYAAYAQREALLRFPDDFRAAAWQWSLSYNLARTGDPLAGQAYADLILMGLNQGDTNLRDLSLWFQAQEPRLGLDVIQLAPVADLISSHLLQVRGPGGAFIWLRETAGAFQADVLVSRFDFVRQPEGVSVIADLTGDNREDVALYFTRPAGEFTLNPPRVFDLGAVPPVELPFQPSEAAFPMGVDFENYWAIRPVEEAPTGLPAGSPRSQLTFLSTVFPACPVTVERSYRWTGEAFSPVETNFSVEQNAGTLSYCRFIVDHAAQVWGPQAAATIMEPILPDWPPETDENGDAFPADARDEWRFRLGIYLALNGQSAETIETLQGIINEPAQPLSRWIEPAQVFLDAYQTPLDIYRACVPAEFCRPADAIRYLLSNVPQQDSGQAIEFLWEHGVTLRANGFFDFDLDGTTERWFSVRHHVAERLEFWILAPGPERLHPLLAASIVSDQPNLIYYDERVKPPDVWLDDVAAFSLHRDLFNGQPYLVYSQIGYEFRNPYLEGLQAAQEALFTGEAPAKVARTLENLEEEPGLMCKPYWTCDPYYYTLGLAHELAGNEREAVDAYLRLWWDYSRSPFTTMARLKLAGGGVRPTATPSLTRTVTPPAVTGTPGTVTPTVTGTPPTPTPSPTGGAPTSAVTPTTEGTPYP